MIQFVSITSFRQALDALLKVKRGVYAGLSSPVPVRLLSMTSTTI